MADDPLEELQRSAAVWRKWYGRLQWYFPDEEAHDYAEELTEVAEGRKRETERPAHEIRREMKLLANFEALIVAIRLLVTIAALTSPFYFLLLRPSFLDSLPDTAATIWVRVGVGNALRRLCSCCLERPFWIIALLFNAEYGSGVFGNGVQPPCDLPLRPSSPEDSSTQAKSPEKQAQLRENPLTPPTNPAYTDRTGVSARVSGDVDFTNAGNLNTLGHEFTR